MTQVFTVNEVAETLRVHKQSIYRFVKQGRLKCLRLAGNRIRFTDRQVKDFLTEITGKDR